METFVGLPDWTCRSLKQCRHPEPGGDAYLRGQSRIGIRGDWSPDTQACYQRRARIRG